MKKFIQFRQEVVNEALIALSPRQYQVLMKAGMGKLMKKHDAYISNKNPNGITISSPNPKFFDLLSPLVKKNADKFKEND